MQFKTELPVGVNQNGEVIKNFSLENLTVKDLKSINDANYRSDHPMVWLGKTISRVTSSIGNNPVAAEFRRKDKGIPDVVKQLTLIDVSYLLLSGHIHNLGTDLPEFKANCPACGNHVGFQVDLADDMQLPEVELQPDEEFNIELINGFETNSKNFEDLGVAGVNWNHYTFRVPKLNDALRNERHWNATANSEFTERVMADCLIEVRSDDGQEMPQEVKQAVHENLILKLSARDMKKIGREYSQIAPSFRFMSDVQCSKCGRGVEVPIDPNFLYSTA